MPSIGVRVSGCGKIGVWLFFVLSGFWVYYPYCIEHNQFQVEATLSFYIKRVFRIYPMYILVLVACVLLGYIDQMQAAKHILLLQAWGHFWAIPVEMKFYLIVPAILFIITRMKSSYSVILCVAVASTFAVCFPFTEYNENSICLFWYLPVFLLGMCTAYFYEQMRDLKNKVFDIITICLTGCLILLVPGVREIVWNIEPDSYLQNKYLAIGLIWAIMILCISNSVYIRVFLDNNKFLQWIGKISYSVYLIHFVVLQCVCKYITNSFLKLIFVIGASIGLAAITERIVERNGMQLGRNIIGVTKKTGGVILCSVLGIIGCLYMLVTECKVYQEEQRVLLQNSSWEERLYVPTMIQKCGGTYFIIDCWNSRILYDDNCSKKLKDWNVLKDDAYLGGHSVASDGTLYVFDNTDMNQILVYTKTDEGFVLQQTMDGIESRPHYVLYDADTERFYVIGSTSGIVYILEDQSNHLVLVRSCQLAEIQDAYVRSISIIDGDLYTVSGPGKIFQYDIIDDTFRLKKEYDVPESCYGMNQISKLDGYWYFTINTDINGDVSQSTILRAESIADISSGKVTDLYEDLGFTGQPYFITYFDNKYYVTEISESGGNGIRSFTLKDGNPAHVHTLFYWKDVLECSKQRWAEQQSRWKGQAVDLFIFMGQINMSGKGDASKATEVEKGWEFRAISDRSQLYPIQEPFGLYENNPEGVDDTTDTGEYRKLGGMVSAFANGYYETTRVPIVGVSCSEGNTAIEQWQEGGAFYNDAVERLTAAVNYLNNDTEYRLRNTYMVWCQGENDGDLGTTQDDYYNQLQNIVDSMIDKHGISQCFVVSIGEKNTEEEHIYDRIIDAQTDLCHDSSNCTLVSTQFASMKERGMMYDTFHYTQEGYNIVGKEAGENAGYWVNTGMEPQIWDYKMKAMYVP